MINQIKLINFENKNEPFFIFRPFLLSKSINFLKKNFNGKILYSVKANSAKYILNGIKENGIKTFDVSSIDEIKKTRDLIPEAEIFFMNPIKPRYSISEAYFKFGVKNFALDCLDELEKILVQTKNAKDLILHIRMKINNLSSKIDLSRKFGATNNQIIKLNKMINSLTLKSGICFHVGSQCMNPFSYKKTLRKLREFICNNGIKIDFINIGGGFPSVYQNMQPSNIKVYCNIINEEFFNLEKLKSFIFMAEFGRSIVTECLSLVVRINLRKKNMLYINDGIHGCLKEAGLRNFIFPVRLIRNGKIINKDIKPFSFYGPTCDSGDFMKGPFYLSNEAKEGDFIEIGQLGSYAESFKTSFNGFMHSKEVIVLNDKPMLTMY